ncbi:related to regulatory protein RLR1 [Phialocephala subalpina]|uniref:THO complex subunit 2 n=1 Tax=Phialocephala subalpina TaxID=576137 RepID=A0A1L7XGA8_9HELO|nr:related to regulatory protein RLR1 [Phialocephala subalpina]
MGPKRKRNDRSSVDGGDNRPSPHRPQNAALAQHDRGGDMRDNGQRRSSRGGQGGAGGKGGRRNDSRNDPRDNPNKLNLSGTGRATPTPGPMSPPPPRPLSAAATPAQTPTPTTELPNPFPKPDPAPYYYEFLTEERMASWETTGRVEVIAAGTQARQDEDPMDLSTVIQEFTRATLDGRIDAIDAGSCVREILGPQVYSDTELAGAFDPHSYFLDIISVMYEAEDGAANPALRSFCIASGVSATAMRQKLDGKMLQDLGLTRETFIRVGVRQATNLLYRQANYNLLREETEGYSKLVTELFTTSGGEPPSKEAVEDTFERVKALIGTFDLDVGRVLDITLDVFAAVLVKHFRFFVKLLRVSSWWPRIGELDSSMRHGGLPRWALPSSTGWAPTEEDEVLSKEKRLERDLVFWDRAREVGLDAFFELGGTPIIGEEMKQRLLNARGSGDADLEADRAWIEATGTLPPSGNRVAAQLLGFKLRFYASEARDKEDVLPANLIYLAALLIKIGFISLRDLYPHLWPLDQDMPALKEARMKELAEKDKIARGGGDNALTRAGALTDDSLPTTRTREAAATKADPIAKSATEDEDKDKLDEPSDQKVQLLTCLLTIGAIPEAMFILGRFPWLPEAYPDLVDLINRILHHSIDKVYRAAEPVATLNADFTTKKVADVDQSGMPKGQVRLTHIPAKKQLRWPFPDKFDTNESTSYRFYWDDWNDNVPVCQTVADLFTLCDTFLNFVGPNIGKDVALLSKLARIGIKNLAEDNSQENLSRWENLLKRLLVPALSVTKGNTQIANEIWDLLRFYPISVRYSIYAEWFQGPTSRLPAVRAAFARTKAETINTMKRISKNNIPSMAKTLSKITFSSPGVVFEIALSQIESYTNLTEVVVECAKYFTDLGFDVLVWSLMVALGGKNRTRTNTEFALLPSRWLLALSSFSGKVYKRYSGMNLSPVLKYVNDQLYRGNATDLVILKELIAQMGGVVPDTDYNDIQVIAMSGGEALRKWVLIDLKDQRFESLKTGKRLLKNLTETKLAGELLISIAQHRQAAIYKIPDEDAHIKLLATMIDDTQTILAQYLDFLRSNLSVEDFDEHVPAIPELLTDFGLDPALAFMIGRVSVAYHKSHSPKSAINGAVKASTPPAEASTPAADAEGDIKMGEEPVQTNGESSASDSNHVNGDAVKEDTPMADIKDETNAPSPSASEPPQSPTLLSGNRLDAIVETVKNTLPESTFEYFSPEFYVLFWASALSDLAVPQRSYDAVIERLISQEKALVLASAPASRSSDARAAARAAESERKVVSETRETLFLEMKKLVGGASLRKSRLLKTKSTWFLTTHKGDDISDVFLEKCLIPRLLFSPADSEYCFRLIRFLHDNGVPHFRSLSLYGRIFRPNRLRTLLFTCTVREAENLGRFLRLVLSDLARWHGDAAIYQKEALGSNGSSPRLFGFAKALDEEGKPKAWLDHDGDKGFRNILWMWHKTLSTAIRECLSSEEWMHIRNAITILKSVVDVYPAVDFQGKAFIGQLEEIAKREKGVREDLALTANTVLVMLKQKTSKWVMVQAFGHSVIPPQTNGAQAKSVALKASKSSLKPTAPEFKPQSRASSLGVGTPKVPIEVEDGEVDDAKASTPTTAAPTSTPGKIVDPKPDVPRATIEPKKSEILDRRDQIKRENAAKASPSPSHATIPPRPDSARGSPLDRSNPSLPSRPDAPIPSRDLLDRHPSRHNDRRDGRDSRLPDARGMDRSITRPGDRPSDRPGDRPREYPSGDRRAAEPAPRDFGRSSDRAPERERTRPDPPPRWTADSARDNHDRSTNGTRISNDGRLSRDMPPPRPSADRGPPAGTERMPLVNPDRQELINPDRAALISSDKDVGRSESPRRGRDDARERGSRPQSPRRHASEKDHFDSRRDDRTARNGPVDTHTSSRGRGDESQPPPAGPRSDRAADRDRAPPNDRSSFQPSQTLPRNMGLDHGRLNVNSRQQPDPNFGRLNSTPVSDIPSGPRDRNSHGNRPVNTPASRRDVRPVDIPRPPTPEKQPPTGPAGNRPRRTASGQFDPAITTGASAPSTPAVASPATGIHPDRLKAIGSSVPQQPGHSQPASPAATPPIHPDRLRALANETPVKPQPRQMSNDRARPNVPPVVTAPPPSGPKGSQSSPTIPQNGFAAPTGPASATERAARGGRRQLAGINTMLQQAQQQGPDRVSRNRGRMGSGIGIDTPVSGPSTPVVPPPPPPGPPPTRDTGRELINPDRADLITNVPAAVDDRERDRNGRRERSGRHSRRSSRSPGRERDTKRGAEDERRSEYRDRSDRPRGDRGEPEKERHQRSSPPKDSSSARDSGRDGPSGRDSGRDREREGRERERDRDRDGGRRDGREGRERDTAHTAGWAGERGGSERGPSGRSRDPRGDVRGDDRRDSRGTREDGGRKRHSDEGVDSRGGRDSKRVRR